MGSIVMTEFASLDGEGPGGAESFKRGAWVFVITRGGAADEFKLAATLNTEALLLGRKSYVVDELAKLKLELDRKSVVHGSLRNWNSEDVAAVLREATDDLETFEWRGVDLLWGRET